MSRASFMAFALGYKSESRWHSFRQRHRQLISLIKQSRAGRYAPCSRGARSAVALVGLPAGMANGTMYLVSSFLLRWPCGPPQSPALFMLVFGSTHECRQMFYDYVPIRTFASHGDIGHIRRGSAYRHDGFRRPGFPPLRLCSVHATSPRRCRMRGFFLRQGFIVNLSVLIMFRYFGLARIMG